ncbi:helix-turn-helix domain-containing protein [Streptomyces albidoflavus]|uniref:helix-turn-helix domain-containing protein n=1 Tax=Streptomyces sp. T7(2022) TaxID=2916034 RepID=UPI001EE4E258|nr:helix-turn-helix transcriptional regulator [Streptomyces sp. T7(2022)]MCG5119248.1 helix-turn-helix transcriptional regulator [Streptomyces sp. T7(2022)]
MTELGREETTKKDDRPASGLVAEIVRILRKRKGYTQDQLGDLIGWTGSAISAVETRAQPVSDDMLVALEPAIGEGLGVFTVARPYILRERFPKRFRDFSILEAEARTIWTYENFLIDGLFQTEEYARALIGGGHPTPDEAKREELVEARRSRRAIFDLEDPPYLELILEESVLRRPFGSYEILRGQLLALVEDSERPNVNVQVLPLDRGLRGGHAGDRGSMKLVETKDHEHVVYMEIEDQGLLISQPAEVSQLTHRYAKIRAQALSPDDSVDLIKRLAGEME